MRVGAGLRRSVEMHDLPVAFGVVGGPLREPGVVRVSGAGEVGPVGADEVRELAVLRAPRGVVAGVEGTEDIFDIVGVERAVGGGVVLVAGGAEVEAVAIDGRIAGSDLRFEPLPGGEVDEAVAG